MRLVAAAQAAVRPVLQPDDVAVDATAGNGHDTTFLAGELSSGLVYAFDIQPQAIAATAERLRRLGLVDRVKLVCAGHEQFSHHLPASHVGRVGAAMFNLGYLPGGHHDLVTRPESTMAALRSLETWLRPGGIVTIVAYRGHAGGELETLAVRQWVCSLPTSWERSEIASAGRQKPGPVLFVARKAI
jgi:predicted methyltransferase